MKRYLLEKNLNKANNQLILIDYRKSKIKKEIYSLYDSYLRIIRGELQNYLEEAIKVLLDVTNNSLSVKDKEIRIFLKIVLFLDLLR